MMLKIFFKLIGGLVVSVALVACGGGGGSPGGNNSGNPNPGNQPAAASLVFDLGNKPTIANSGSDSTTLTVTVLNAGNNVLSGVPVEVSLSPDGVFRATSGNTTNAAGQFSGQITIGDNKANRIINATIRAGGLTRVASVLVTGSQITVTPVPATPIPGQTVTLNITALDSAGAPISGALLTLSGSAGVGGQIATDLSGNRSVSFLAPSATGSYSTLVSGLGIEVTRWIEVVSGGASGIPPAVGTVVSQSLTPDPTNINANQPGSTTNRSTLRARFQTTGNTGIANMRVRFEIVGSPLGNGEAISTGLATVYTNASGEAVADYIAGTRTSPTNGVSLRACYSPVDFTSLSDCPNSVLANLTVAGTPLSISITDNNELTKGLGNIAYVKRFLIQVNDASGVAVADAIVSASVDITHYGKGAVWGLPYLNVAVPSIRDLHPDYTPGDPRFVGATATLTSSAVAAPNTNRMWCLNEDFNRNGFLDSGEDLDGDGGVEPRKAEITVSYVNGNRTDANGQLLIQVTYGQTMGGWLAYTLRATTGVVGSEGDASRSFVTDVLQADVQNGSFLTPPFGRESCRSRN